MSYLEKETYKVKIVKMAKKGNFSERLAKLEAHLSVVGIERVKQLEEKLENVSTDVSQNVKPSLERLKNHILDAEKPDGENSERIKTLESAPEIKKTVDKQQSLSNYQVNKIALNS